MKAMQRDRLPRRPPESDQLYAETLKLARAKFRRWYFVDAERQKLGWKEAEDQFDVRGQIDSWKRRQAAERRALAACQQVEQLFKRQLRKLKGIDQGLGEVFPPVSNVERLRTMLRGLGFGVMGITVAPDKKWHVLRRKKDRPHFLDAPWFGALGVKSGGAELEEIPSLSVPLEKRVLTGIVIDGEPTRARFIKEAEHLLRDLITSKDYETIACVTLLAGFWPGSPKVRIPDAVIAKEAKMVGDAVRDNATRPMAKGQKQSEELLKKLSGQRR